MGGRDVKLTTSAFADSARIPSRFTCDGADLSPPLSWSDVPAGTKSFALVCSDPDAPSGTFYHWALFDLPPSLDRLPEDYAKLAARAGLVAINDFGRRDYNGPCPPPGSLHHYHFTLYALGTASLGLRAGARCSEVERAAKPRALAKAEYIGTFSR